MAKYTRSHTHTHTYTFVNNVYYNIERLIAACVMYYIINFYSSCTSTYVRMWLIVAQMWLIRRMIDLMDGDDVADGFHLRANTLHLEL